MTDVGEKNGQNNGEIWLSTSSTRPSLTVTALFGLGEVINHIRMEWIKNEANSLVKFRFWCKFVTKPSVTQPALDPVKFPNCATESRPVLAVPCGVCGFNLKPNQNEAVLIAFTFT